jgi:PHD/YefM family antitoxin component YafN of YafNO toxin-antitoxin module
MKTWSISEARARLPDVIDAAIAQGPQRIERGRSEPVVVIAESDWNRLLGEYTTFADLVLRAPLDARDLPERRPARVLSSDKA